MGNKPEKGRSKIDDDVAQNHGAYDLTERQWLRDILNRYAD
jgi:hypothetical protein